MVVIACFFSLLLLFIEYRIFLRMWDFVTSNFAEADMPDLLTPAPGYETEMNNAIQKKAEINFSDVRGKLESSFN